MKYNDNSIVRCLNFGDAGKRGLSLLIVFVMLFSMIVSNVPVVYAEESSSTANMQLESYTTGVSTVYIYNSIYATNYDGATFLSGTGFVMEGSKENITIEIGDNPMTDVSETQPTNYDIKAELRGVSLGQNTVLVKQVYGGEKKVVLTVTKESVIDTLIVAPGARLELIVNADFTVTNLRLAEESSLAITVASGVSCSIPALAGFQSEAAEVVALSGETLSETVAKTTESASMNLSDTTPNGDVTIYGGAGTVTIGTGSIRNLTANGANIAVTDTLSCAQKLNLTNVSLTGGSVTASDSISVSGGKLHDMTFFGLAENVSGTILFADSPVLQQIAAVGAPTGSNGIVKIEGLSSASVNGVSSTSNKLTLENVVFDDQETGASNEGFSYNTGSFAVNFQDILIRKCNLFFKGDKSYQPVIFNSCKNVTIDSSVVTQNDFGSSNSNGAILFSTITGEFKIIGNSVVTITRENTDDKVFHEYLYKKDSYPATVYVEDWQLSSLAMKSHC